MNNSKKVQRRPSAVFQLITFVDVWCDNICHSFRGSKRSETQWKLIYCWKNHVHSLCQMRSRSLKTAKLEGNNRIIHGSNWSIPPPPTLSGHFAASSCELLITHMDTVHFFSVTRLSKFKAQTGRVVVTAEDNKTTKGSDLKEKSTEALCCLQPKTGSIL